MNLVILRGNVGANPQVKNFENGGKIATFSLATTERGYTNKEGKEIPDRVVWHNIVIRRAGLINVCEMYVGKGSSVLVVGKIETREYKDNSGQTRYVTEIIADELELLGGKEKEQKQEIAKGGLPF